MERINFQNVNVSILDAETKEVILHDFLVYAYPIDNGNYRTIRGGCDTLANLPIPSDATFVSFGLEADQVTALGYDYKSLEGNVIYFTQVGEVGGTPLKSMPRVVNIYLKKLA